ncbi:unnamed protein product [Paramecium primaurelia]|uniref:Uncharacterized protein n=1 Tax=Paramecium primaurelia TaxID=5886 RepID=A0A8S1PMM8_PARPR|nr:unnamed protein product [Paramecium primaurelia]
MLFIISSQDSIPTFYNCSINRNLLRTYYLNPTYQFYVLSKLIEQYISISIINLYTCNNGYVLLGQHKYEQIQMKKALLEDLVDVFKRKYI